MVAQDKKRVQITLSLEILEKLEKYAKQAGITKSSLASLAVTEWIREREQK